jgi:uncharacterized integral membrane protein
VVQDPATRQQGAAGVPRVERGTIAEAWCWNHSRARMSPSNPFGVYGPRSAADAVPARRPDIAGRGASGIMTTRGQGRLRDRGGSIVRFVYIGLIVAFTAVVLLFKFQNLETVTVSLFSSSISLPVSVLVVGIYLLGMFTGGFVVALLRSWIGGARGRR